MQRRKFLGTSVSGAMALVGAAAHPQGPQPGRAPGPGTDLPSRCKPAAYSFPPAKYTSFATPDYFTFADDLVLERARPGKPHQGKVLAAIQPHSDDIPLFAAGTVLKLIDEGYTGHLIRVTNDDMAGPGTIGETVLANERDNDEVARRMGLQRVFNLNYS